ncbi:MAG: TMEM175 family protein [Cyclobacteriaceae bacterium]
MRSALKGQLVGLDSKFRHRGLNQTRIETFSDAVFAVAFTLVVLSTSVPETFDELRASINDIVPSFICIVLLVVIWYQHYIFFLRYGLQDTKTVTINTLLLFLLLIYIYPLKFLARFLYELYSGMIFGRGENFMDNFGGEVNGDNMTLLMVAYGLGACLIFLSMSWLYRHCHRKRDDLELDEYEIFATKVGIWQNLLMSAVPFLSVIIISLGLFGRGTLNYSIGGFIYMLYPPVMILFGRIVDKKSKAKFG